MKRKFLKKAALCAVTGFLCITMLAGCTNTGSSSGGNSAGEKDLTVAVTSFADTLEPTEQYFSWVVSRYAVGETIVKFNEEGKIVPCLAEEWNHSEDGKTWTFKIKSGIKFSNGNDMTAESVKSSLERTFEKSERAKEFFKPVSIKTEGENLIIETEKPCANLDGSLADPLFLIVDTTADESLFASQGPVCTGPYKVESFSPSESCVVSRNEYYWDGEVPFDKVTFKCIDDQTTRSMALQTEEVDAAYNLKTENIPEFEDESKYTIDKLQSLRSTYAFLNEKGPLKDKKLRQAVLRGINRETYCNTLLEGGATPGKAPVPPTLDFGFDELKDENSYNPESAKKLLEEAGYKDKDGDGFVEKPDGSPLDLNFVIYTSREELNVYAQAAQADLKKIGIKVTLKTVSYETLLDIKDSGDYDMLIWNVLVANTGDPEKYLRENWYSTSVSNTFGYSNKEVDKLLDELEEEFDEEKRRDLIIKIQQHIMDDASTIFFGYETTYLFSLNKVKGLKMYPMDYYWLTKDVKF